MNCWMHLKYLRVFAESVLRFGIPIKFQAVAITVYIYYIIYLNDKYLFLFLLLFIIIIILKTACKEEYKESS